ncbi:MAG: O-antigen ligase family protein [Pseudomonadota bacterium]
MPEASFVQQTVRRVDLVLIGVVLLVAAGLGGSSLVGVQQHGVIQLAAMPLLLWLALRKRPVPWSRAAGAVLVLLAALAAYAAIQAIAGIPGIRWADGSPRALVEAAQPLLGLNQPAVGISLAPGESIGAMLALMAPLAVFVAVATARWSQTVEGVCWIVVALGAVSAGLGLGQLFSGADSPLYLYGRSALPLGLFSNPNHQASFLVMALPVSLALLLEKRQDVGSSDGQIGLFILAAAVFLLLVVGIIAAGSIAGYAMLAGVIPLCILLSLPSKVRGGAGVAVTMLLGALVLGGAATVMAGLNPTLGWAETDNPAARAEVWRQSLVIARDHFPFGVGFGAFEYVYPLYETEGMISSRYMNAAHNEYLQVLVELGAVGVVLLAGALALWAWVSVQAWRAKGNDEGRMRRAASIASLVVILHSIVDYPLHAPFYAIVAAALAGILCLPPRHARQAAGRRPAAASDRRIDL